MSPDFSEKQQMEFEHYFRDMHQKLTRAFVSFFVFFFLSFVPLIKIHTQFIAWTVLILWISGGTVLWWYFRKYWKCPACAKRWDTQQLFASKRWDYCPDCGAPLTRSPREMRIPLNLDSHEALKREFRRRRRLSSIALGLLIPVSILILIMAQNKGLGREGSRFLGAVLGAVLLGIVVSLSRCLNCKKGIVMGSSWRCPHCGVSFK